MTSQLGQNFSRDNAEERIMFNDIKKIRVEKDKPSSFFYKTSYSDQDYGQINLNEVFESSSKRRKTKKNPPVKTVIDINKLKLKKAYKGKFNIAETKKRGLLSLVKKNVTPNFDKHFYENL